MNSKTKIFFAILGFLFFVLGVIKEIYKQKKLFEDYTLIESPHRISGKIVSIKTNGGTSFLIVDTEKILIRSSENYQYTKPKFVDHINIGEKLPPKFRQQV